MNEEADALGRHQAQHASRLSRLQHYQQPQQQQQRLASDMQQRRQQQSELRHPPGKPALAGPVSNKGSRLDGGRQDLAMKHQQKSPRKRGGAAARIWMC